MSISSRAAGTIFTTVLTFMLTVVLALSPVGMAHAADRSQETPESQPRLELTGHDALLQPYRGSFVRQLEVTELEDGSTKVHIDGQTLIVEVDEATSVATVTEPDGTRTEVDLGPNYSSMLGGEQLSTRGGGLEVTASSSTSCTFIMWVVGLIHSSGWFYAIAIVAATGAVGAAVLLTMYALGAQRVLGVGSLAVLGHEE